LRRSRPDSCNAPPRISTGDREAFIRLAIAALGARTGRHRPTGWRPGRRPTGLE